MANGVVTAKVKISTAQILQLTYNGTQVTDGGTSGTSAFYWQGNSGSSDTLTIIADPSTNGGNYAEIDLVDSYLNNTSNADAHRHFAMFRGSPGIYAVEIMSHTPSIPAGGVDVPSFTCKLGANIFNWLAQDTGRNLLMPTVSDLSSATGGINNAPAEVTLLTQGLLAGRFDCKYDYSGDLGSLGFSGWCSSNQTTNMGLWCIHPSHEYFSCGPMHREILAQMMLINTTFKGVHFGFHDDMDFAAGENWTKVLGPFFLYFNKVASGTTNSQTPLYADAAAQAAAEQGAWPCSWFTNANYVPASGRGTVAGQIVINDAGNPNASASNLWVGVASQPSSTASPATTDFQLYGKCYQFWTKTDANGNFSIPNVIAGTNYTLFAFGPGAIGQFQSQSLPGAAPTVTVNTPASPFSITVIGGQTDNLGSIPWTPTRVGATVWELGVPDRDTTEFRHGVDYWHGDLGSATNLPVNWAPCQDFSLDFPDGLTYTVGQSHWATDWDNAQGTVLDPTTGNLNGNTWTVSFNLPSAPTNNAQASIYFGIAASYQGAVIVQVNGSNIAGSTGFFPYYSSSGSANDAMIRMGSHGIFSDWWINFDGSLLHQGPNTITLNMRKGGYFANSTLYDYMRLELAGYVPPAPSALTADAGNGLVALYWPSAPGATGYSILRSTTSGSGYVAIATNVTGPVCGSLDDTASFTDTTVVNDTTYYYAVQSANPNGNSTNSVEAAATPSEATASAPPAPTGLTATPGNNQVTLNWTASPGAARYIVQRTVLTIGAVTTYTPGGINPYAVINSFVSGSNYTDTALANAVTYSYVVSAANANGQSGASAAASATPLPNLPVPPTGLTSTVDSNQVTLSWNVVNNAANYIVSRATAVSGPYSIVANPEWLATFTDAPVNYNTTYYYEVASANLGGISSNSAPLAVTTCPAPPAPVTAVPGNAQVSLTWGASAGATNYVLQRSTVNGGPYSTIVSTANTSYLDTGLNNGTTYYYVVYAVGPNGQSPLSAQATATPSALQQMIKSDTTTMNSAADWSGVAPVAGEVGLFNNIISSANEAALTLGGDVTVGGFIFTNNLNGAVSVAAGNTLTLGSAGIDMSVANQNVTFNNAISLDAPQIWNVGSGRTISLNGAVTETGTGNGITETGAGTLAISGSSSFADGVTVNQGTVSVTGGTMPITLNGGTFFVGAALSTPVNVTTNGGGISISANRTLSGAFTGSGTANVSIGSSSRTLSFGADVFSGCNGTIALGTSVGGLRWNSSSFAGGDNTTFDLGSSTGYITRNNSAATINLGALLGGSGTQIRDGNATYVIGGKNIDSTFSGNILSTAAVVKKGTGTFIMGGANTYTGGTTVSNGTLLVANTGGSGLGTGGVVTVVSGATLGGNGVIGVPVTITSGATLSPGTNNVGTLTISNNLVLSSGAVLAYDLGSSSDLTLVSSNLTLGGTLNVSASAGFGLGSYTLFTYGGTLTYNGISIGTAPAGYSYSINTNTPGQVSLVVSPPLSAFQQWQMNYFGCTNCPQAVPDADPLGKGISNTNQFLLGLNPTNAASVFRITSVVSQGGTNTITWSTAGVRTNVVQGAVGDASGGYSNNFSDISPGIILPVVGDTSTNYTDPSGTNAYYRIRLGP